MSDSPSRKSAGRAAVRNAARGVARDLVPPLALKMARRLHLRARRLPAEWELLPGGFEQARADAKIKGWNQPAIGDVYARDLQTLRERLATGVPLGLPERAAPADFNAMFNHNLAATWGWVLGRAAAQQRELSVLDWGGALGHYYLWARALRPDLKLDYTIKEMPLFVEQGAQLLPEVRFCGGDEALERDYDLVLVAGAFHYEEAWRELLPRLLGCARRAAFLTRIPIIERGESFVFVQRPYAYGYATEYPSWCFNRAEFVAAIRECGWHIERETITGERVEIKGAFEVADYRGFLLRPEAESNQE